MNQLFRGTAASAIRRPCRQPCLPSTSGTYRRTKMAAGLPGSLAAKLTALVASAEGSGHTWLLSSQVDNPDDAKSGRRGKAGYKREAVHNLMCAIERDKMQACCGRPATAAIRRISLPLLFLLPESSSSSSALPASIAATSPPSTSTSVSSHL